MLDSNFAAGDRQSSALTLTIGKTLRTSALPLRYSALRRTRKMLV
ncbi:hypothetical protein [Chlorogloeopsis fritschii]|nr:hypothetical protein [Chlorogloeopsis fritschii]